MENTTFTAALDSTAKWITAAFLIAILTMLAWNILNPDTDSEAFYASAFLFIPITLIAWGFHPSLYRITDTAVVIKRPFGSIKIPIEDVIEIREISTAELGISFRLFASGGLFGYFGVYTSSSLGKLNMWSTNKQNLVLIVSGSEKFIISPADPGYFILQVKMKRTTGGRV